MTTFSIAGELNLAPMGPHFPPGARQFELRPFESSRTFRNLCEHPVGVFHVTDDVLLIARAALDQLTEMPAVVPAATVAGFVLQDCCRWYEFEAHRLPMHGSRQSFHCRIVSQGSGRQFYGFNRAKHAVLEATILATRVNLLPIQEICQQCQRLELVVQKTGGPDELAAFELLTGYLQAAEETRNE